MSLSGDPPSLLGRRLRRRYGPTSLVCALGMIIVCVLGLVAITYYKYAQLKESIVAADVLRSIESQAKSQRGYRVRVTYRARHASPSPNLLFAATDLSGFVTADYEVHVDRSGALHVISPACAPDTSSADTEHVRLATSQFSFMWQGTPFGSLPALRRQESSATTQAIDDQIVVRFPELPGTNSITVPSGFRLNVFPLVFELPVVTISDRDNIVVSEYISTWTFTPLPTKDLP